MNRATTLYIAMIAAGALGVWAIMSASKTTKAPPEFAGEWRLEPVGGVESGIQPHLVIEQSGRYVRIRFGNESFSEYVLDPLSKGEGTATYALRGSPESIVLTHLLESGSLRIERFAGPETRHVQFEAFRIEADNSTHVRGAVPKPSPPRSKHHLVLILLVQIAIVLGVSQLMGRLFEVINQPKVMGEMIAGILLGPSLLGWLWPEFWQTLFPPTTTPYLSVLSQLGVIFFLFLIGLELDPKLLRHRGHAAVVVSHASIVAPFVLGGALAIFLYPLLFNDTPAMRFSSVALFMGAAMSITAFPVLARILTERNLHKTPVGAITITCAAVDDVTAWCMLAFVVGFARADGLMPALATAGASAVYIGVMLFVVRPLLGRLERLQDRQGGLGRGIVSIVFLLVLASAAITEAIGIHALFGAFLMGAIMPKGSRFVRGLTDKIEDFVIVVLLPIFFAYTGLRTQIGLINSTELWILTGLIILVACAGKFGGSTVAARVCGMTWRESAAIGILMNTRGLMELVILNIGRDLGVITDAVFVMMVLMAIVTTFLTTPILNWVYPERLLRATRTKRTLAPDAYGILIPVSLPRSSKPLIRLADVITGRDDSKRNIIGLHLHRAEEHDAYRAAVDDHSGDIKEPLVALAEHAAAHQVPLEPLSFVSRDPAADIARIAEENRVKLILMGFHNPVIGQTFLGGTVHRVLDQARSDVAIFIDRGLHDRPKSILVPYLGSPHDKLALDMASRMGRNAGAAVTVLHIVPPGRNAIDGETGKLNAKTVTDRVFSDPTQPAPVSFKVVEHADPIAAVLEHAKPFDLVAIGIAEEWGLTSQLFGMRAERIARDCPSSLLIMHRHSGRPLSTVVQVEANAATAPMQTPGTTGLAGS